MEEEVKDDNEAMNDYDDVDADYEGNDDYDVRAN